MTPTKRRWLYLAAVGIDLLASVMACGSDNTGPSGGAPDGGRDATHGDAQGGKRPDVASGEEGSTDAGSNDAVVAPGAVALCQAEYGAEAKCKAFSPACLAAIGGEAGLEKYQDECAAAWSKYESSAYLQAVSDCLSGPGGFGDPNGCCFFDPVGACADAAIALAQSVETCSLKKLAGVTPDPADEKLRADFCKTCPDTDSKLHACAGFFDIAEAGLPDGALSDAGSFGGIYSGLGLGSFALIYSDAIVSAIDMSCTGAHLAAFDAGLEHVDAGTEKCFFSFMICAESVAQAYEKAHPPPTIGDNEDIVAACRPDGG